LPEESPGAGHARMSRTIADAMHADPMLAHLDRLNVKKAG
jgi:hypothetical protein